MTRSSPLSPDSTSLRTDCTALTDQAGPDRSYEFHDHSDFWLCTGTVNFSCTNLPATIGCVFSPASIAPDTEPTPASLDCTLALPRCNPDALAGTLLPARGSHNRVLLRSHLPAFLPCFCLRASVRAVAALHCSSAAARVSCFHGSFLRLRRSRHPVADQWQVHHPERPLGASTITVTATGTAPTGATVNIVQQFNITLTVK